MWCARLCVCLIKCMEEKKTQNSNLSWNINDSILKFVLTFFEIHWMHSFRHCQCHIRTHAHIQTQRYFVSNFQFYVEFGNWTPRYFSPRWWKKNSKNFDKQNGIFVNVSFNFGGDKAGEMISSWETENTQFNWIRFAISACLYSGVRSCT